MTTEENFCIALSVCAFIPFLFGVLGTAISHKIEALIVMLISLAVVIGGIVAFIVFHTKKKKQSASQNQEPLQTEETNKDETKNG